ncbi:MAG: type II secretion system GspH family protein [Lentisphaeria bacterium]|nr:type II secretion system GspH family protein [Lentisphaeria bacterium]
MNRTTRRFTLVEMLTVIAIISILAGLVIPVVIIAQERGRETQAKSDIASLVSALKQLDADYGKMLKKTNGKYCIGNKDLPGENLRDNKKMNGSGTDEDSLAEVSYKKNNEYPFYNALIAELSAPKNAGLTVSVNSRKKIYLEPKKGFDPAKSYSDDANTPYLWRDPWGNPYRIYIKVKGDDFIALPDTEKNIASKIAVYSCGPNGTDDKGCSNALDSCIVDGESNNHKMHDDIASWDL